MTAKEREEDFKKRCTTFEQCLPVSDFRILAARLHNEMIDALRTERTRREEMASAIQRYMDGK